MPRQDGIQRRTHPDGAAADVEGVDLKRPDCVIAVQGKVKCESHPPYMGSGRVKAPGEDALLRMQAVLGFVEDHRLRTVDDGSVNLLATMGRQAVHEDGVGLGSG